MKVLEIPAGASQAENIFHGRHLVCFFKFVFFYFFLFFKSHFDGDFPLEAGPQWISNDFNSTQTGALAFK